MEKVIVIGGGAQGKTWLQILSDIWQKPLLIPQYLEEATSMGAAICGGVGIGAFSGFGAASKFNPIQTEILPRKEYADTYGRLFTLFNQAYEALSPVYLGLAQ